MRSYEQTPHALTRDTNISLGARALYPLLRDLAWMGGRRKQEDAVELPSYESIADALGCAPSTCRTYVSELRATGWIETVRASRRRPSLWIIRDDPSAPKSGGLAGSESAEKPSPSAPESDVLSSLTTDTSDGETTSPPAIVLIEGQNLPLNALLEECGIDPRSPRIGQAVAALNGRGPRTPGIRDLFWEECRRYADETGEHERFAEVANDPEQFARLLEKRIREKVEKYRRVLDGATVTPTALLSWWFDMEKQKRGSALTPEEIARIR